MATAGKVQKFADDGFSAKLYQSLEERIRRIRQIVEQDMSVNRQEIAKFVWSTVCTVYKTISPKQDAKRHNAWTEAAGMLKDLVDFQKFTPVAFRDDAIHQVLEKVVLEMLERYQHFVLTGEVKTKQPPPKLLGETDEIICVDKPCHYTCSYGGGALHGDVAWLAPKTSGFKSASELLNADKQEIQIHEYLALKYNFETAVETKKFWASGERQVRCDRPTTKNTPCGKCNACACMQTGCCNRLDKETSGVMVAAKTMQGFVEVRQQFSSEHNLEKGGTEKYYLALVHGTVKVPEKANRRSEHWLVEPAEDGRRVYVDISCRWDKKALCYDNGKDPVVPEAAPQEAKTFFEPVVFFTDGKEPYTLVHVQIITGRRHQIRFHLSQAGYVLAGDYTYGAPNEDREITSRMFLHSYLTKFREPLKNMWYQACSPLPEELGKVLEKLQVTNIVDKYKKDKLLSRRQHRPCEGFLMQYDPNKKLLEVHPAPEHMAEDSSAPAAKRRKSEGGWQRQDWQNGSWSNDNGKKDWKDEDSGGWSQNSWNEDKEGGGSSSSGWKSGGWKNWNEDGKEENGKAKTGPWVCGKCGWKNNWKNKICGGAGPLGCNIDRAEGETDTPPEEGGKGGKGGKNKDGKNGKDKDGKKGKDKDDKKGKGKGKDKDKGGKDGKKGDTAKAAPARAATSSAPVDENSDDDAWGDWGATSGNKTTSGDAAEPAAKRPRMEAPGQQPVAQKAAVPQHAMEAMPMTPPQMKPQVAPAGKWERKESRSSPGVFYYWHTISGETRAEPPPPWEKRESRSKQGVYYYWNTATGETSVTKPMV
eukprot:TRINITY_DN4292_c0_g1_i2.p1 TRINITY_DN4292_c0_g1~~TRINITY_DN4292_c0_g1_i2.p1  ORF type:complete len:814 (-),score=244.60 TRINITY_DN4292_c0_g1_i2:113-2554(-)